MNRKEFLTIGKSTVSEFTKDDDALMAAGLTYYAFFSLFPLLLLMVTIAGLVLNRADANNFIFTTVAQYAPGSTKLLSTALDKAVENRRNAGIVAAVGFVVLAFSGSNAFSTLDRAINRAWETEHKPSFIKEKIASFLMMVVAAGLLLVSVTISALLTSGRAFTTMVIGRVPGDQVFWQVTTLAASFALAFIVLFVLYRYVPRTDVEFRDVWWAALLASAVWTLVKEIFALYIGSSLANYDAVYGTMGAVIALMTWIYISSLIVLAGAEFASETRHFYKLQALLALEEKEREDGKRPPKFARSPWFSLDTEDADGNTALTQ